VPAAIKAAFILLGPGKLYWKFWRFNRPNHFQGRVGHMAYGFMILICLKLEQSLDNWPNIRRILFAV
jgi:hypothetical protein